MATIRCANCGLSFDAPISEARPRRYCSRKCSAEATSLPRRPIDRFLAKVDIDANRCWLWTGTVSVHGYGRFYLNDRVMGAHQASVILHKGPIPDGLEPDHLCRVRRCVNPEHLELVTRSVNLRRGVGFIAEQAKRTHCPNGHPLVEGNLDLTQLRHGKRSCKQCKRDRQRGYSSRQREVV